MRVDWSAKSRADVLRIAYEIQLDSPTAALSVAARIEQRVAGLAEFEHLGRTGRAPRSRELVIVGTPYIAVYRVHQNRIVVLRVIHGKRLWPLRKRS